MGEEQDLEEHAVLSCAKLLSMTIATAGPRLPYREAQPPFAI